MRRKLAYKRTNADDHLAQKINNLSRFYISRHIIFNIWFNWNSKLTFLPMLLDSFL